MNQLGIEPNLFIAQVINFIIIIVVLSKLLYKPILDILEKRKKEIAEGLALTEKMRVEDEKLAAKRAKLLDTARDEANAIITEAKKTAKDEADTIITNATSDAAGIIDKGKTEVELMKKMLEKDMRTYAVTLAVAMAKRLLKSALPNEDREKILDRHLKELESVRI